MPVMDERRLRETAEAHARAHLEPMFKDPILVEATEGETEWDEMIARHVHDQEFEVWRTIAEIEWETDALGRVVRFSDSGRIAAAKPSAGIEMPPGVLHEIARTTGLVSEYARILGTDTGGNGLVSVNFNQYVPGFPAHVTVSVDPGRGRVASLQVTQWDEP